MPMGEKLTILTALAFEVTVWIVSGFVLWAMIQGIRECCSDGLLQMERGEGRWSVISEQHP